MKELQGKVAIVTGAAHPMGMGFAACRKLAEAGATVVLTDLARNEDELNNLLARVDDIVAAGGQATAIAVDVTQRNQIGDCIDKVKARFGRIDILFNNAGTPVGCGDFLGMTDRQWDVSYQVNLKGLVDFCQGVIPLMVEQGGGAIINNASLAGLGVVAGMAAYNATKFAVVGTTKTLAAEFGRQGVRVNALCPGMIWTQMSETEVDHFIASGESRDDAKRRLVADVPLGRWGQADEVANAVVFLAGDRASYISGVALPIAGGLAPGL